MTAPARVALLAAMVAVVMCVGGCQSKAAQDAYMRQLVRSDISQVMSDIHKAEANDPNIATSSSAWDYVGISPAFGRLVARGRPALDAIASEIEQSDEDGLRECLLAIAGQSIMGAKGTGAVSWSTGKEWAANYRSQQGAMPSARL